MLHSTLKIIQTNLFMNQKVVGISNVGFEWVLLASLSKTIEQYPVDFQELQIWYKYIYKPRKCQLISSSYVTAKTRFFHKVLHKLGLVFKFNNRHCTGGTLTLQNYSPLCSRFFIFSHSPCSTKKVTMSSFLLTYLFSSQASLKSGFKNRVCPSSVVYAVLYS